MNHPAPASQPIFLDCTFRDGGYYNSWDFSPQTVLDYLEAMPATGVDVLEMGFRSLKTKGFAGAAAYTTDEWLRTLPLPGNKTIAVMVNGAELVGETPQLEVLERLFPNTADSSPVDLVRVACHVHEFERALPAVNWLKERGYQVGYNLMQVSDRTEEEVKALARAAAQYPLDVLYFADSFGSMDPDQAAQIIQWMRTKWSGPMGIHTHDNKGLALSNSMRAIKEGVTWVDSTVTGMGRGPGNARTEELAIEMASHRGQDINYVPLMGLLRKHFKPMQEHYGWGTNPYYYMAAEYSIHPTYIQTMLGDARYDEEDILAVIDHLRIEGGAKYDMHTMDAAREFYGADPTGEWAPNQLMKGRDVLLLGTGPGVATYREPLEQFIRTTKPLVIALNTQTGISSELIDIRAASHPIRLLADSEIHAELPQPLLTPFSMLPEDAKASLGSKKVLDFGLQVQADTFAFDEKHCVAPTSLVMAYVFAAVASGEANSLYLAGFDGFPAGDMRNNQSQKILNQYTDHPQSVPVTAITPTTYDVVQTSVYGML
ncbi:aldolase catalytic domain-containing protein [Nesterenkonia sp. NBAIMH1]|uniref:aldolase catalytic domain-containing protein n=1 Tax=Nesterenkonia sp. NBAIMH1 TaxID=2600320 RepID=UPI0011B46671|nr:aldolase catalytic domain-containing protein [Nesterenkonia sp. NBAIMH1]